MMTLKLRVNPLETIGVSRHLIERFVPENGISPEQLAALISKVAVYGSVPFHPDTNQNPNADQVFKDIQNAASEVDTPEKLAVAVQQYLARPTDQVAQVREQYNSKLAQIQERLSDTESVLLELLISNAKGNELFAAPELKLRRFCVDEPAFDLLHKGKTINFSTVFFPDPRNVCEYHIDDNGNIKKYKLERSDQVILADLADRCRPKPEEIILNEEEPTRLKSKGKNASSREVFIHPLYTRASKAEKINDLKIIGTLYFGDENVGNINEALNRVFGLSYDTFLQEAPKTQLIAGKTMSQDELLAPIVHDLVNGIPLEKFKKLLGYVSQDINDNDSVLIAYRKNPKPSIVLVGRIFELHKKTPNLYRKP